MSYITNEDGSLTYQFAKSERPTLPPAEGPLTAAGTDAYLVSKIAHPGYAADPVIARAQKRADEAGLPDIQVTLMQGQFLAVLARSLRAERILEIGTLAGISTIFLARTLPPHGQIDTLEFSPQHAKIAQENFLDADLYPFPKVHIGAAMDTLTDPAGQFVRPPGTDEGLKESERGYDLIFIDADKDNILGYWLQALRLVRKGGVIIVDNAVRGGRISLEVNDQPDIDVKGLRQIYDWVEADQGKTVIMSCLQTVGAKVWDGFAMATKL